MIERIVSVFPWWAKIVSKLVLSRLRIDYSSWAAIGLFRHGKSDHADYSFRVFKAHYDASSPPVGFVTLEFGPGDAVASAVLTKAFGGSASFQVDVGSFANRDAASYQRLSEYCANNGLRPPDLSAAKDLSEVLQICSATYSTNGLGSLRDIESQSVDFIYSQSCLEHIRLSEFLETAREMRRVLRPGGVASHWVDFKDHLSGRLDNLRFDERLWESEWMANSGFYTNRLRAHEIVDIFCRVGFTCHIYRSVNWNNLPTNRIRLSRKFKAMSDDQLLVSGIHLILR